MKAMLAALLAGGLGLSAAASACDRGAPRMRIETAVVRAGDRVVVRFASPPVAAHARGDVWLALVPDGSPDGFLGERVIVEEGALEATIPAAHEGRYELRLVDASPRRLSRVVGRAAVDVEAPVLAESGPPAWYW